MFSTLILYLSQYTGLWRCNTCWPSHPENLVPLAISTEQHVYSFVCLVRWRSVILESELANIVLTIVLYSVLITKRWRYLRGNEYSAFKLRQNGLFVFFLPSRYLSELMMTSCKPFLFLLCMRLVIYGIFFGAMTPIFEMCKTFVSFFTNLYGSLRILLVTVIIKFFVIAWLVLVACDVHQSVIIYPMLQLYDLTYLWRRPATYFVLCLSVDV